MSTPCTACRCPIRIAGSRTPRADVRAWLGAQATYTEQVRAQLVGQDSLAALVEQVMRDLPTLDQVRETPAGLVLTRWLGPSPSLFALDRGARVERAILSDSALAAARGGASLRAYTPSWDGAVVAIGTTEKGDRNAALSVVDAASGALRADRIPDLLTTTSGTRYEVTWLPDNSGFFYPRQWPGSASGASADRLARGRQFLHRLGTPQSADVPVFGFEVSPSVAFDKDDLPTRVLTGPDSRWLVGSVFRARRNGTDWYVAPLPDLTRLASPAAAWTAPRWTLLADTADLLAAPQLRGDTVYALMRRGADRGAIVRRVLRAAPDVLPPWETVVAERAGVITAFSVQADGVYFTERAAGAVSLRHLAPRAATARPIALPVQGTVRLVRRAPTEQGAVVSVETWATTPQWLRVRDGFASPLGIDDGATGSRPTLVSGQLEAPSHGGARVPVSFVYDTAAMGHAPDGTAPLLIETYGAFGTTTDPHFEPRVLAWVAQGGVYAWAHVRGGGELGDAWHRAATKGEKQRTIDDMIAAIEALIAQRLTSAGRVVVTGTSFGAMVPALVAMQRPALLAAALYEVGQPDEIRGARLDPTAARNIAEIGDLDTEGGVRQLLAASAYHQVPREIALPAMLLHSASGDYNFGTEMLIGKYVARLQAANRGRRPVVWVRTPGGHGELFYVSPAWGATVLAFVLWQAGDPRFQPGPSARR
ncbi:MAG: prolyl oligopeptidase family serine peptidase [Gemmatimonadetes bacterium]|nr:prolyl oligopeptidase family serine peptidase [Gemmatimonadota bacterium]